MLFFDDISAACAVGCMSCHSNSITWQPTVNFPYAVNFGGASPIWYGNINAQFCSANSSTVNCGSRHHLGQIWSVIKNDAHGWGFNSDPHPCVACHPPHHAQRNHPVEIDGEGKLNTAIRRPEHYNNADAADLLLWGDDEGERMSDYATQPAIPDGEYQAPYYGDTSDPDWEVSYEPAGDATSDGSNLPDYVTFCMDCHVNPQYNPDTGENVKAIVWDYTHGQYPDIHGAAPANTRDAGSIGCMATEGSLKPPYDTYEPNPSNYVLSCLDCHEPHGTYKRLHLIRLKINGEAVGVDSSPCDQSTCHGTFEGFHGSRFECASDPGCDSLHPENCPHSF
jgi:hypothetical protein